MENKVCKNKKCRKVLPDGYKHKYCEACRKQNAQKVKNAFKLGAGMAGRAASFAETYCDSKKNPKK